MRTSAGRKIIGLAAGAAVLVLTMSGCGQRPEVQTEAQTGAQSTETEAPVTEAPLTEAQTQEETQKLITSVDYTSKDGSVKITLPDNSWKVTQDADEMRVFQSGNAAIINIVHASTATAMKNLSVLTSEEELKESLKKQYTNESDYDVVSFTTVTVNEINIYRYLVSYNAAARMWAYSMTSAIVSSDEAYIVTGTVTDDDEELLLAVQKAVESFRVLGDEAFKAATGEILSGTTQKATEQTSETVSTDTASTQELTSLTDYGTSVSLVTSDNVNVRALPGTDADILTTLTKAAEVTVVGETSNWFKVSISGNIGYIRKDFLVYASSTETSQTDSSTSAASDDGSVSSAEINTATAYGVSTTLYATDEVNVRSMPGTDSSVINALSSGESVTVTGETDNWFVVSINGVTGYVSKALLSSDASSASTGSDTGSSGTSGSGTSGGETSAVSSTTTISGQVTGVTVDTITIQATDGSSYTVYYGSANVTTADGLYSGVDVVVTVDSSQSSGGTLYAQSISGN